MVRGNELQSEKKPTLADLLNRVLESAKEDVANLNEALAPKNGLPNQSVPSPAEPSPACPDESKSA
jgi:hypothetical protein